MPDRANRTTRPARGLAPVRRSLILAGATAAVVGCSHHDSYLDPSVVGRWERTPTKVPILDRIAAIEDEAQQYVEVSDVTSADLLPETDVYRVGPGDFLSLTIWDLVVRGQPEVLPRGVDQNGYIEIPQLGRIFVSGLSESEVADAIAQRMNDLVDDPLVSVVVEQRRSQTFHLMGNVPEPGPYFIPSADYRLLEALVSAGGFPEFVGEVFIIRQVPLSAEASGLGPEAGAAAGRNRGNSRGNDGGVPPGGEDLIDIIDDLTAPGDLSVGSTGAVSFAQPGEGTGPEPIIDLTTTPTSTSNTPREGSWNAPVSGDGRRWVFRAGSWIREAPAAPAADPVAPGREDPLADAAELITQRVMRVPIAPLVAGDARYNVIVRPGDIIRVPVGDRGNIYLDGEVARPGVYQLPQIGRLTLTRAITAAGGLGGLAIPERIDITRMVGPNQQATIMLDLRAISEGTQPDLFLKPDDRVNVGTNFWATPLAVIRGGFRATYGFGFLLDRNFGNDVFGAPPSNVGN